METPRDSAAAGDARRLVRRDGAATGGLCLVHRAEIMQMQGAWEDALDEARRAAERFTDGVLNQLACGKAFYRQGEVHRLRGALAEAEEAYAEQVTEAVSTDEETAAYVAELERRTDELDLEEHETLPSGDTLAAELTRFLRERDAENGDDVARG